MSLSSIIMGTLSKVLQNKIVNGIKKCIRTVQGLVNKLYTFGSLVEKNLDH